MDDDMLKTVAMISQPITILKFSSRTFNCLDRCGIHTIADLLEARSKDKIKRIGGLGNKSLIEINEALNHYLPKCVLEVGEDILKNMDFATRSWIPYDRLSYYGSKNNIPKSDGKYLCCWKGNGVDTGVFLNGHFMLSGEIKDDLVIAWMPLPKPYKEDEE